MVVVVKKSKYDVVADNEDSVVVCCCCGRGTVVDSIVDGGERALVVVEVGVKLSKYGPADTSAELSPLPLPLV